VALLDHPPPPSPNCHPLDGAQPRSLRLRALVATTNSQVSLPLAPFASVLPEEFPLSHTPVLRETICDVPLLTDPLARTPDHLIRELGTGDSHHAQIPPGVWQGVKPPPALSRSTDHSQE